MISKLLNKLKEYLELQADIVKLSLVERIAIVLSFTMFLALCTVFAVTIFILAGITIANLMNDVLSSSFYGYIVAAGLYLLILLLVLVFKKRITSSFTDLFIKIMAETEDNIDKQNSDSE